MTNIDSSSSNNILFNTSFNPFEEKIINIKNNKSKTVKDFFTNIQTKPLLNQMGKNFIIKNSKIKRENKLKIIKDKINTTNSFFSNQNIITPITNYSSYNKFNETIKKPLPKIRSIINLRKKDLNKNKDDNEESFKRDYYYEECKLLDLKRTQLRKNISLHEIYTQNSKKLKNEKFQFFGSSSAKYNIINLNNISNENIGPGSYFKEENSFLKKRFFKSNSQKVFSLQKNENEKIIFPGPGEYNLSSNFIKKPISNIHCFNSCEKRFNGKFKNENFPGPGNYIQLNNWKLKSKLNLKKIIFKKINNNDFIKRKNDNNNSPFNYDLNIYSIETQNQKKIKKNYVPFGSQSNKFIQIKNPTGENIGPGSYIKNITNINKSNNNIHFHSQRCKNKNYSLNNLNLPISYGEDSYFDWHKKSFNIQYV